MTTSIANNWKTWSDQERITFVQRILSTKQNLTEKFMQVPIDELEKYAKLTNVPYTRKWCTIVDVAGMRDYSLGIQG